MSATLRCMVLAVMLLPTFLNAQTTCVSSEEALRALAHDYWAAYNGRDVAAMDKLLDDRLVHVTESGTVLTKAQLLAPFRAPEGSIKLESAEQPENIRTVLHGDMAVMSFTKSFKVTHKETGASFGTTVRMTETFVCTEGRWKIIAFQETVVADPARQVYRPAVKHFDDYVGTYRFGADGTGGKISVTRRGDSLFETWGTDKPIEILPGKFDVFFTPGIPILERFVRDRRGRVVGIVYTMGDRDVEAKRVR